MWQLLPVGHCSSHGSHSCHPESPPFLRSPCRSMIKPGTTIGGKHVKGQPHVHCPSSKGDEAKLIWPFHYPYSQLAPKIYPFFLLGFIPSMHLVRPSLVRAVTSGNISGKLHSDFDCSPRPRGKREVTTQLFNPNPLISFLDLYIQRTYCNAGSGICH